MTAASAQICLTGARRITHGRCTPETLAVYIHTSIPAHKEEQWTQIKRYDAICPIVSKGTVSVETLIMSGDDIAPGIRRGGG